MYDSQTPIVVGRVDQTHQVDIYKQPDKTYLWAVVDDHGTLKATGYSTCVEEALHAARQCV